MRIAFSLRYKLQVPEGHKFPIDKYELVHDQLLHEGTATPHHFFEPPLAAEAEVLRVHKRDYFERVRNMQLSNREVRRLGFPLHDRLFPRSMQSVQGTIAAAENALASGIGYNLAGGTHHAYANTCEGFSLFNDIAVAAAKLLAAQALRQVLVLDLDVHQGNGTAAIFRGEPRVFTFSMHCQANYPLRKESSDWDIGLPVGTSDAEYLRLLQEALPQLLDELRPDLVFYQGGVDVLATDRLGKLGLSKAGCRQRDKLVLDGCHIRGIPVAAVMGGGYSERLADIVEAHCNTYRRGFWLFD